MSSERNFIGQENSMLERLCIKNYVLIPELDISFPEGFSVLTGETGSGKTIILSALSLLLGAKADKEAIRKGESYAEISGVFSSKQEKILSFLDSRDIFSDDGKIIIRRVIRENGRSSASINGALVTLADLSTLSPLLIDITSQFSNQSLLSKENQMALLDQSAGLADELKKMSDLFSSYTLSRAELKRTAKEISEAEREREYNEFSLEELKSACLTEGEDEEVKNTLSVIENSEVILENMESAKERLQKSSEEISAALKALDKALKKDESVGEIRQNLENLSIDLDEMILTVREKCSSYSFDEYLLSQLNDRNQILTRIKKKYGPTISDALKRQQELEEKIEKAEKQDEIIDALERRCDEMKKLCETQALLIRSIRIKEKERLEKKITDALVRLDMKNAEFYIKLEEKELSALGSDRVSFLIKVNKGEKISELENSASGGELSRIMLAIKSSFSSSEDVETLIFDEIDTGLGGETAYNVASELSSLSSSHQIIAITHLAQIAVKAASHFLVSKKAEDGRTVSHIRMLDNSERVEETARLLSGKVNDISLAHAKSLLKI